MNLRLPVAVSAALAALALLAPSAFGASTTVVISQFAFHGPTGANDELIQLRNVSATAQDIGGWTIVGTNATGATSTRATITAGTTLPPGNAYLLTNIHATGPSYSGPAPG